jgi:nicotinamidase-related amidase
VLSTVREAMDRDYQLVVLDDATADPDPATHAFLTAKIFPRHAIVIDVDDLPELWT